MTNFIYVDTEAGLKKAAVEWSREKIMGIDLECENNLHHYGVFITLIQVTTGRGNWIIDAMAFGDLKPLVKVFEDPKIEKVLHDTSFDLRILNTDLNCQPKNIFDTHLAAQFLCKHSLGLGALMEEYFNKKKESRFQKADWTKRPLKKEMLEYAIKDTKYLIKLSKILKDELHKKGRLEWVHQELKHIEGVGLEYKEPDYIDLKGVKLMHPHARAVFKRLYQVRDKMARQIDRPVHFVMSNKKLKAISTNPPKTINEWKRITEVHPMVKRRAELYMQQIEKAKNETVMVPKRKFPKRVTSISKMAKLSDKRDKIAERLKLPKHLILNNDQMHDVVNNDFKNVREWQRKLILE